MAKHKDIYNDIFRKISNGIYKPGDKIPTGNELCEKYHVSRITAVRAMNDLEAQGLIKKIPGNGTFVSKTIDLQMPVFHLFLPGLRDSFYVQLTRSFSRVMEDNDAMGCVVLPNYNMNYLEKAVNCALKSGSQGIAVMHSGESAQIEPFTKIVEMIEDVPVVVANRYLEGYQGHQLLVDEEACSYMGTNHLISLGHRKLAFIKMRESFTDSSPRYKGFLKACHDAGITNDGIVLIRRDDIYTMTKVKSIFKADDAPTAVVCPSEDEAIIAYEMLSSFDIKIPEDLALVAIYGSNYSNSTESPFTSVDWPGAELGKQLAELFLNLARNPEKVDHSEKIVYLPPTLTIRHSCGADKHITRHEILKRDISRHR